jgi:hypothetical protein
VSLSEDRAGTVWVTFAEGEPSSASYGESFSTWRIPVVDGEPGQAEQVSEELVSVAATPFDEAPPIEEPSSTTTAPSTTTEPVGTSTLPSVDPPSFVYLTSSGALMRHTIGGESTVIAQLDISASRHPVLAPHPDGATVYLSLDEGEDPCTSTLYAVSLSDGRLTEIAEGSDPAVSPDGTRLAYTERDPSTPQGWCPTRLVVRDLASGSERRWRDPITHGEVESISPDLRLMRLAWASDNRTVALSANYEGDLEYLVDTEQPEGDLVYQDLDAGDLPVRDPSIPHAEWWMVGTADLDGRPAVVVQGACYGEELCDGDDLARFVPLDGAVTVDATIPSGTWVSQVGPDGFLLHRRCDQVSCRGNRLSWLPIGGTEQVVVPGEVEAAAWLP